MDRRKKIIGSITPPIILDFLKSNRNSINYFRFKRILNRNRVWDNKFAGEQIIILGNGPSLKTVDLKLLEGKKVIVMNSFEKADWKDKVEIIAHCIGEPYGSRGWSESSFIESIEGTDSHSYWLHYSSYNKLSKISKPDLVHYVFPGYESAIWGNNRFLLDHKTLAYQTTAQLAIQVAFYMGFNEILLLGFDHDWLASPDYSKHFYSDVRDPMDVLIGFNYFDIISLMHRMWNIYYTIKASSEKCNIKIYNLSQGSYLDVFECLSFSEFDKMKNKLDL